MGTASYPLNSAGFVFIKNLPSGVWLQFQCIATGPGLPHRWDVNFVKDPWFVPAQLANGAPISFAGYCATGVIEESGARGEEAIGDCRIMDRQVSTFYGCSPNIPIANCKAQFCKKYANRFTFPGLTGTQQAKCVAYATSTAVFKNFIQLACSMSKLTGVPIDPNTCTANYDCRVCMDAVTDFPDQIADVLGAGPTVTTVAPTAPCLGNLSIVGVKRKLLTGFQSGVQIDFNNNGVWTGVFALLDEEIAACGGCNNELYINGSLSDNAGLVSPGQYRIRQSFGVSRDPTTENLCTGPPGYNATLVYANPSTSVSVSAPFGKLFGSKVLVCSTTAYPKCPLNNQCCVWDRLTQKSAWEDCMVAAGNNPASYPKCGL
ncbi:hypothetical protein BASA82_000572 [Batrachochytrium salamandrivorans]|nr:hypothetical protein BASA82_000572 [Batrachochytrium salamandrivorans]